MASEPIPQNPPDYPAPPDYLALDRAAFRRSFLSRFDTRDRAALHELGRLLSGYVTERSPTTAPSARGSGRSLPISGPWRPMRGRSGALS
jgi:hypothetical protein